MKITADHAPAIPMITRLITLTPLLILSSASALELSTVTVGNPGNAPDPLTGLGKVDYTYEICQYEITNAQFCEYANACETTNQSFVANAGYIPGILVEKIVGADKKQACRYTPKPGMENLPFVANPVGVSIRLLGCNFATWMNGGNDALEPVDEGTQIVKTTRAKKDANGRPLKDDKGKVIFETVEKEERKLSYRRKAPAQDGTWYLADANELFKAAFHDAKAGPRAIYFDYATGSNRAPGLASDPAAKTKLNAAGLGYPKDQNDKGDAPMLPVGASSPSPYGAYDLCGNAAESFFGKTPPEGYKNPPNIGFNAAPCFGGANTTYMTGMTRSGCFIGVSSWSVTEGNTTSSIGYSLRSEPQGFRLVRIKPTPPPPAPAKPAKPAAAPKLALAQDGDVWFADLPNPPATGTARSGESWQWARDTLAAYSGKAFRERSASEQSAYGERFKRTENGNIFVGLPLMPDAAALETQTDKWKCNPVFDLSTRKEIALLRTDYNKVADKSAKVETNPAKFDVEVGAPFAQLTPEVVLKARRTKVGDISKFEQKVTESLKTGLPMLWLWDCRIVEKITPQRRSGTALIIGQNLKTHEIIFTQSPDDVEPYALIRRLPVADAYAATTGLYQVKF